MREYETHMQWVSTFEKKLICLNSHTLHRSSFTLWPISRNLILYASLRGQYITVVYGYEMSVELNTLAISPPASSPFLAGHLRGGWIIRLLPFSSVVSSHWVGNEKCHFQMSVFTSFIFVIIICCLSLTVSVFSPVVSSLFWNLRLLKRFFSLFLQLLRPRSSLVIYSSCYHGGVRWHKAPRGGYSNDDRICPCVLLLFWLCFFLLWWISSWTSPLLVVHMSMLWLKECLCVVHWGT